MQFHPNDLSELDELTEEHLGFSALSDGLGFSKGKQGPHPATKKGMEKPEPEMELDDEDLAQISSAPTAQEKSRQMSFSGTGAVAAGPMRPAPSFNSPFAPASTSPVAMAAKPKTAAPATAAAPSAAKVLAEPAAARWMRASAFLIDALVVSLPLAAAWILSFGSNSREIFLADPISPLGLFGVIFAAYFLLSESFGGQSLGKMALNLRVVEDDKYQKPTGLKHAVIRLLLFVPSTLLFGVGLIASFWDSKRRPWHDRYSNSIVRRMA